MNLFFCAVATGGTLPSGEIKERVLHAPCCASLSIETFEGVGFWGLVADDGWGTGHLLCRAEGRIALGTARLDCPAGSGGVRGYRAGRRSDLANLLSMWPGDISQFDGITGEFAVVLYDETQRTLLAARDALGVDPLYYRAYPGTLAFSSRAELLAIGDEYDRQYFAEFVAGVDGGPERTPFTGVSAVPPGHIVRVTSDRLAFQRYWSPEDHAVDGGRSTLQLVDEFRECFANAVGARLEGGGATWAQLSGGLDSSSVVSMAATLCRAHTGADGLGGTVTLADRHGTGGDERRYAEAVATRFGLRNEQLIDYSCWQHDGEPPPRTDRPSPAYLMYARDRGLARLVRGAGGRVLLTGYGSDQYLTGSAIFLADWVVSGRIGAAVREIARWAIEGRVSFWSLALHNAGMPLFPRALRKRCLPASLVPAWVSPGAQREFDLTDRTALESAYGGPRGRKYTTEIIAGLGTVQDLLAHHAVIQDIVEERHPFLDRRLVELVLGMPPGLCAQPGARKWVLREAMRGLLPDLVRTRRGKGSWDANATSSLSRDISQVEMLLDQPYLAEFGCVDPKKLLDAVRGARDGTEHLRASILRTLAVETWLQARSGRWPRAGSRCDTS